MRRFSALAEATRIRCRDVWSQVQKGRSEVTRMGSVLMQRFLLAVVPAALIAAVAISTLFGDSGYLSKLRLEAKIQEVNAELSSIERSNSHLLRDLMHSRTSEKRLERTIVDEMGLVAPGTVLYTFPYEGR